MSYTTLLYVWDAFTFIIFMVVLISSFQSKNDMKNNSKLIVVSLFLFTGMFLFYREQLVLYEGGKSVVLTFFTYAFSALAHMLIVSMIVTLYTKKELSKVVQGFIVVYGVIVGIIMVLNLQYGNFLSTHILLGLINSIPAFHIFFYVLRYDKHYYRNVFMFQIILLLIVYTVKTINLIVNYETISFSTANYHDIGMLTVANVIIFSFVVSYLLVRNSFINQELLAHRRMIEISLSDAISLSEKDALTELFNRRKILNVLDSFYRVDSQSKQVFSIILIDVDNFKEINDEFGHNVGDEVLVFISKVLRTLLRDHDFVSRWGGDEFLILLPNTGTANCVFVVNKIKAFLKDNRFTKSNSYISLSFGMAESTETKDINELLELADSRMYSYKDKTKE